MSNAPSSRAAAHSNNVLLVWGPRLIFGLRLWLSVSLALYIAFWLQLDNAYWAGTSAAIVCQPQLGASLRKGWFRMIGTVIGAVMSVALTACFPQDRFLYLLGLALWGAACTGAATLLRNFGSYSAALAGYTVAIISADQLGTVGGVIGDTFMLAVTRATEICIGIVSAGVVLAGTDLGGAPRRLTEQFANLSADIASEFVGTLRSARPNFPDTQPIRREITRQVIALDSIIDQSLGESSRLRYHSAVLQRAVDGLFAALSAWRAIATHFVWLPNDRAQVEAERVLHCFPPELQAVLASDDPMRWISNPAGFYQTCDTVAARLMNWQVGAPSLRLLIDQTAGVFAGLADAQNGLALLIANPARSLPRVGSARLRVPDWLPALVNTGRTFVMLGAVELFWVATAWPGGAGAIAFAAITVILLAPRADQAYAAALGFTLGTLFGTIAAGIINFLLLPGLRPETFFAFSLILGLYLVPVGAMIAQPWLQGLFVVMAVNFVPILGPANEMSYDTLQFYNQALAIVGGVTAAALSFRLLPPLCPAFRARRLLGLTLRDLRRLATGRGPGDWQGHIVGRLLAMPEQASPLQRAQLLAALSAGNEIIRLRHIAQRLDSRLGAARLFASELPSVLAAFAQGDSATAAIRLAWLDAALADQRADGPGMQDMLRAHAGIIALSEVLNHHAAYLDCGVSQ